VKLYDPAITVSMRCSFLYLVIPTRKCSGAAQFPDDPNKRLMFAARSGVVSDVESALSEGTDVNATNRHGFTPLIYAVSHASIERLRALLNAGANRSIKNEYGETALTIAERASRLPNLYAGQSDEKGEMVALLKKAGAIQ